MGVGTTTQHFPLKPRFGPAGAEAVAQSGLAAYVTEFSALLAEAPGNGVGIAEDMPAFWAAAQLRARVRGVVATSELIPLTPTTEIDTPPHSAPVDAWPGWHSAAVGAGELAGWPAPIGPTSLSG